MRSFTRARTQLSQVNGRLGSLCVVACTLLTISAATPSADSTTIREGRTTIQDSSLRQYRAYRRMHARNEKFGQEAWLECWTELDERGFRYDITTERGSDYVLNKVLKTLLRREQELIAEGQTDRADLTPENYEFAEPAVDEVGQRYVTMKPKRKDVLLLDGRMVLNSEGLDGVRVPVSTESVARLKFAGISRMDVQYEYETINGRPVSLGARQVMASSQASGR
jgi:hypothetical protein